jgi:hypothetical protein
LLSRDWPQENKSSHTGASVTIQFFLGSGMVVIELIDGVIIIHFLHHFGCVSHIKVGNQLLSHHNQTDLLLLSSCWLSHIKFNAEAHPPAIKCHINLADNSLWVEIPVVLTTSRLITPSDSVIFKLLQIKEGETPPTV